MNLPKAMKNKDYEEVDEKIKTDFKGEEYKIGQLVLEKFQWR